MAFNDLQMKAAAENAVLAAHKNIAKIQLFSHSFTELEGRPGEAIAVPVYDLKEGGDFQAGTNDYGTGAQEIGGILVNLDKHLVKSVSITDKELAYTGINWVKDTANALAERLTLDINKKVFGEINSTNITIEEAFTAETKETVANLYALADKYDIPADKAVVVLDPENYAKVLSLVDYSMIGSGDYIETGVINGLFGFKGFVCSSNLPDGTIGAIILDEAIGIASKYLAPMTEGAYPEAWSATDEGGFTLGFRRFMDLKSGKDNFACDCLFGVKILQPTRIVRLVGDGSSSTTPKINALFYADVASNTPNTILCDYNILAGGINLQTINTVYAWTKGIDRFECTVDGASYGMISVAWPAEFSECAEGTECTFTFVFNDGTEIKQTATIKK